MTDHLKEANRRLVRAAFRYAEGVRRQAENIVKRFPNMRLEDAEDAVRRNTNGGTR